MTKEDVLTRFETEFDYSKYPDHFKEGFISGWECAEKKMKEEYFELYMKFAKVLDHVTQSHLSKPETSYDIIIQKIDETLEEICNECFEDGVVAAGYE